MSRARYTIMRPVSIEAGYRYLNLSGQDNITTTPWLTARMGIAPDFWIASGAALSRRAVSFYALSPFALS
ncbi:YfaZ family outer membrane protein [Shigella flexneri]